jgi:antitoxin component YwqK of YwqJK toxin-antitoxin module
MKHQSRNNLLCLIILFLSFFLSAEENLEFAAKQNRRFLQKRDFISFLKIWNKKHIKYHAFLEYDETSSIATIYDEEKNIVATGTVIKNGEILIQINKWKFYYPEGQLLGELSYKNGLRDGKAIGYYQNRKVALRAEYKKGVYNGERKRYSPDGTILDTVNFYSGEALKYEINELLVPSLQRPHMLPYGTVYDDENDVWIHRDIKNQFITLWYRNGQLLSEINAIDTGDVDEKLHGKAVFWYIDGSKWMEGNYNNGRPSGNWIFYTEDGKIRDKIQTDDEMLLNNQ